MSRIGKIARLPRSVREELNRRMEDGEQQNRLVEWLNAREDVQAVLKADFGGKPINEPNLTAWAQGGFEDWRRQQESHAAACQLEEEGAALGAIAGDRRLSDRASEMAALALAQELMAIRRMEDGAEKRRAVLKIVRGLVRLRKSDRECERGQREAAQAERRAEIHEDWAERVRRPRPAPPTPRRALGGESVGSETVDGEAVGDEIDVRERMAEVIGQMSDEEIAETLRRSGHLPGRAEDPPSPGLRRAGGETVDSETVRPPTAERTPNAQRVTSNVEGPSTSILPEGGTPNHGPDGRDLTVP